MEEYILQSQQTVSPDTIINPDEVRCHEIEDEEECNNEEAKLKRKASAEEVAKLKRAKVDQVGHMKAKTE